MTAACHLIPSNLAGFSFAVYLILVINSEAAVFKSVRDVYILIAVFQVNSVDSQAVF